MMAHAKLTAPPPDFKSIKLDKDQVLGVGAYGRVCKALCDDLQCAAKILHPNLILTEQQQLDVPAGVAHRLPMRRFERECEFLRQIRHPNIILFLGLFQDDDGLPVLLMEILDQNLTSFLESGPQTTLPFHTQVSICHDISLALAFLHSNGIIHRDLSSNNVLMIGDRRAKVTDFGMAVFEGVHRQKTETPGTAVYMPPEVKGPNPLSDKSAVDVFSFGVLSIQIMTRKFPDPVDELLSVSKTLWGFFSGSESIEIARRQNHIGLISKDHPLLCIAFDCLKKNHLNRPTSSHMCSQLRELKTREYVASAPLDKTSADSSRPEGLWHHFTGSEQLECPKQVEEEPWDEVDMKELEVMACTELPDISENIGILWRLAGQKIPKPMQRVSDAVVLNNRMFVLHGEARDELHALYLTHHEWSHHTRPPVEMGSLAVVNSRVVLVGGKYHRKILSLIDEEWTCKLPSMPTKRHSTITASSPSYLIVMGGVGKSDRPVKNVEVLNTDSHDWFSVSSLPEPCAGLSARVCRGSVYVFGGSSIFTCDVETLVVSTGVCGLVDTVSGQRVWAELAEKLPVSDTTAVVVGNTLYAVGGRRVHGGGGPTAEVYRYNRNRENWCVYSHLKEARSQCFVAMVTNPTRIIVVGGVTNCKLGSMSNTMESASWRQA